MKKKTKKQTHCKSLICLLEEHRRSLVQAIYLKAFVDFNIFPTESQTVDQQPQEKKTQHVIWEGLTMMPHPLVLTFKCNLDSTLFPAHLPALFATVWKGRRVPECENVSRKQPGAWI